MKVELSKSSDLTRQIEVEIEAEESLEEVQKAYDELKKRVKLPGFRPGKIPRNVLEMYYSKDVKTNVKERLLSRGLEKAIKSCDIDLASRPKISNHEGFELGEPYKFKLEVELKPKIDLKPLSEIVIEDKEDLTVTEDEIASVMDYIRHANAPFVPIEGSYAIPVQNGDQVCIKGHFLEDDKDQPIDVVIEGITDQAGRLTIDKDTPPLVPEKNWFEGKIFKFSGVMPLCEAIPQKIRGTKGTFEGNITDIKRKELPDIDDEFAKDIGMKSVELLKDRIKEDLVKEKRLKSRNELKRKVTETFVETYDFPLPKGIVEENIRFLRNQHSASKSGEHLDEEWIMNKAKFNVKWYFLADAILKFAGIEVRDSEVRRHISNISAKGALGKDERLFEDIRSILLENKLYDFLLKNVTIYKDSIESS